MNACSSLEEEPRRSPGLKKVIFLRSPGPLCSLMMLPELQLHSNPSIRGITSELSLLVPHTLLCFSREASWIPSVDLLAQGQLWRIYRSKGWSLMTISLLLDSLCMSTTWHPEVSSCWQMLRRLTLTRASLDLTTRMCGMRMFSRSLVQKLIQGLNLHVEAQSSVGHQPQRD